MNTRKKAPKRSTKRADSYEEDEFNMRSLPLQIADESDGQASHEILQDQILDTPDPTQRVIDTPSSERTDPSYCPPETPRSRRELQMTRPAPQLPDHVLSLSQDIQV